MNVMKTNIVLIGYMGTGKTAVGRRLAEKLGMKFIEVDSLIEKQAGRKITDIFHTAGGTAFREMEIEAIKKIAAEKRSVIACGGGVVLNRINIDRLQENGVVVYLTASTHIIMKRVSVEAGKRPLLEIENQLKTITDMLKFRKPFYERSADITINTSRLSVEAVAENIIQQLKKNESLNFKK